MKKHHISISRILPFLMVCVLVCGTLSSCQSQPTATTKDNDISILTYDDWFHGVHIGDSDLKARSALAKYTLKERSSEQYVIEKEYYSDTKIGNIEVEAFWYVTEDDGRIYWIGNMLRDTASDTTKSTANYEYIEELLTNTFGKPNIVFNSKIWTIEDGQISIDVVKWGNQSYILVGVICDELYQQWAEEAKNEPYIQ